MSCHIDSPGQSLGIPAPSDGYCPLWDNDIPQEARGPPFVKWISSYFKHGDLSSRDFYQLAQREVDTSKTPTIETIPQEELLTITDFVPGIHAETGILSEIEFSSILDKQTMKALLDPQVREDWGGHPVWLLYGEATAWNILHGAWELEKKFKASDVNFKSIPGANHFVRRFFCPSICSEILFHNS